MILLSFLISLANYEFLVKKTIYLDNLLNVRIVDYLFVQLILFHTLLPESWLIVSK